MSFAFDGECEKDAFITYCCLNYKVFDKRYQRCFKNYLLNIHPVNCFENRALPVCYIMDILFEKEICEFYGIYLILQDLPTLIGILEKLEFEDKFSFIGKCDFLFQNEKRKPYVHALRSEFEKAIMEFCADVSVNEYDVDINSLLDGYIFEEDDGGYIDGTGLAEEVKNVVEEEVYQKLYDLLQALPQDFMIDKQFLNGCGINVTGSDSLVIDYLNDDDISYKYEQEDSLHRDYEIESMFNHFINRAE